MGTQEVSVPEARGEVAGSFLLGLVESFHSLQVLPDGGMRLRATEVDPARWYPHSMLVDTLRNIEATVPAFANIFFRAGVNFLRIWHDYGPGKEMVHSSRDWLYANSDSGGYNTVVRGGSREEIGWCRITSMDEAAGLVVYENVTPLPPEFVRGIFYGGCVLYDDLDFVDVSVDGRPYGRNPAFIDCTVAVRFRYRKPGVGESLDAKIHADRGGPAPLLSAEEAESLLWRYRSRQVKAAIDEGYYEDIGKVLEGAIAAIQAQHDEIKRLSNSDTLTGLPNLRLLRDRLQMALNRATRDKGQFALLFIDLDGFKDVNDTHGHEAGDFVLKAVAIRLSACVRSVDTVARHGGDEFCVVLTDMADASAAGHVARKIISALSKPIYFGESVLAVGASVGIALFPRHGRTQEELLKNADSAMYAVKRSGKNGFAVFAGPGEAD